VIRKKGISIVFTVHQLGKYYTQHISYDELITTAYSTGESEILKVNCIGEFRGGSSACLEAGAGTSFLAE
jgi:hypothetical protein